MLGLSQPTLMKLVEFGEIDHVKVGTHHQVPPRPSWTSNAPVRQAARRRPRRWSAPAAGGGLDHPPSLGARSRAVSRAARATSRFPAARASGLVGGLADGRDAPGGLGGDGRVRPRLGGRTRPVAPRRCRQPCPGRAGRRRRWSRHAGGLGGRGLVAHGFRGDRRPGVGDAGPTALDRCRVARVGYRGRYLVCCHAPQIHGPVEINLGKRRSYVRRFPVPVPGGRGCEPAQRLRSLPAWLRCPCGWGGEREAQPPGGR